MDQISSLNVEGMLLVKAQLELLPDSADSTFVHLSNHFFCFRPAILLFWLNPTSFIINFALHLITYQYCVNDFFLLHPNGKKIC